MKRIAIARVARHPITECDTMFLGPWTSFIFIGRIAILLLKMVHPIPVCSVEHGLFWEKTRKNNDLVII
jgi:hypothetical protein